MRLTSRCFTVWLIGASASACHADYPTLRWAAARETHCPESEMKVLESERSWSLESWVVECRGRRYYCETTGKPARTSHCRLL